MIMDSKTQKLLGSDFINDMEKIESLCITRECSYGNKCLKYSEKFRHSGNILFNSSPLDLRGVLKHYSKSILYAPTGSEQLSLAYANRSAVLFREKYYEECLEDISRALKAGYPDSLKPKLLIRRVKCNYALTGNVDFETDEGLIEARGLIEKLPANNKMRKMVEDILNNPEKITSVGRQVKKICPKYQPEMKGRNPHLPGASDAIALRYSEEFGRHLVATRDINSGEVLLMEKAYAMIVPDEWIYYFCSHCAKRTWNGIPCDYCIYVMFCSDECKRAAWQEYHDVECKVLGVAKMMRVWDHMLMGLRITVKAIKEAGSLEALRKRLKELDRVKASDVGIPIDPNSYETFYIVADNLEHYEVKQLLLCSSVAEKLAYALAVRTNLFGERESDNLRVVEDSEQLLYVGWLISRNIRIAMNRAFSWMAEEKTKTKEDQVVLLMPVSSFLNSRCYDTAEVLHFEENSILVTPVPISRGDQIFTHYCPDYKQAPRDLRRKILKDHWHFVCNCLACTEDWSSSTSTWDKQHLSPKMILDLVNELDRFQCLSPKEIKDPKKIIPFKEHFCKLIDFMYPRVKKPCTNVEQLVTVINEIYKILISTVYSRFFDEL